MWTINILIKLTWIIHIHFSSLLQHTECVRFSCVIVDDAKTVFGLEWRSSFIAPHEKLPWLSSRPLPPASQPEAKGAGWQFSSHRTYTFFIVIWLKGIKSGRRQPYTHSPSARSRQRVRFKKPLASICNYLAFKCNYTGARGVRNSLERWYVPCVPINETAASYSPRPPPERKRWDACQTNMFPY